MSDRRGLGNTSAQNNKKTKKKANKVFIHGLLSVVEILFTRGKQPVDAGPNRTSEHAKRDLLIQQTKYRTHCKSRSKCNTHYGATGIMTGIQCQSTRSARLRISENLSRTFVVAFNMCERNGVLFTPIGGLQSQSLKASPRAAHCFCGPFGADGGSRRQRIGARIPLLHKRMVSRQCGYTCASAASWVE